MYSIILIAVIAYVFVIGILMLLFPPNKNSRMGYRTELSLSSDEMWWFSQRVYGSRLLLSAFMMLPVALISYQIQMNFWVFLLLLLFEAIIAVVMAITVAKTLIHKKIIQ